MRVTMVGMTTAVLVFLAPSERPTKRTGAPALAPHQAQEQPKILLAEVMFALRSGDTAFVELANVGGMAVDLTSMVLRIDTLILPLPRLAEPFAPGTQVLIRFDERGTIEGNVVHASEGFELNAASGVVSLLRNDDYVLDRVAWGTADGAVRAIHGGRASSGVEPGSSFGRPPGANRPGATADWVLYPPGQTTPGRPNPMPPVIQLLPLDGAILETSPVELNWYPVAGAVRYRVQLGKDSTFGQTMLDQTVSESFLSSGELAVGVYWWRVQAIGPDGVLAAWSRPNQLELAGRSGGGNPSDFGQFGGLASNLAVTSAPVVLNVPYLSQHKDTRMLLLESLQEGRVRTADKLPAVPHKWDDDHGRLDKQDPADNTNCGLASMAMINRFYGGDLSQDRIGYELFSRNVTRYAGRVNIGTIRSPAAPVPLAERAPGPEWDLNYAEGLTDDRMLAEGLFALGALPGPGSGYLAADAIWALAVAEIDAGRPLMAYNCCHLFVVRGYELRGTRRLLYLNDPWSGSYPVDLDAARPPLGVIEGILSYPTHAAIARQEPSVTTDADTDGVVDFDEVDRFHTDPSKTDSDADGVNDKQDIESGIYEVEVGYGYAWAPVPNSAGRDYDHDGTPTELDADSDNGGCKDGDEDLNGDGIRAGTETFNFDETDDVCGNLQGNVSYLIDAVTTDPNQIVKQVHNQGVIRVRLKPESPGSNHYIDNGSTFSYQGFARSEIDLGQCILWGRVDSHGSGTFTGDQIGATREGDTLAFGALTDVPAQTAGGGCLGSGSGQTGSELSFPHCEGILAPRPAGAPPGVRTYTFNCTTKPYMGSEWTVIRFYARGYIRLQ